MLPHTETAPPAPHGANPYQPRMARIVRIQKMLADTHVFTLRFLDEDQILSFRHLPGQFVMLSIPGTGEAPISISSSPTRPGILELCVRRAGRMTSSLFRLSTNDVVGVRGPYGNGFPVSAIRGNHLLLAAGGLGMAPLRSLLWYALDNREMFDRIILMYGSRNPAGMLFRDEMLSLAGRADVDCMLTVDADPDGGWTGRIGHLPSLFDHVTLDPARTYAAVCGPPVVYRHVLGRLLALGFSKDRILMSLERRMKCGIGKCGHCSVGYKYTCMQGPIFTYWDAINLPEMI